MKKITLLFFIFYTSISVAQKTKIPEIKYEGEFDSPNNYITLLKLKDEKSLIIKISFSNYWLKGTISEFIVYQNDGKVLKYISDVKNKIKRKSLKKKNYFIYWDLLNKCIGEKKIEIQKNQLNITSKPSENGETQLSVSDGTNETFELWKENKYIVYSSQSPLTYINEKYPGYQERQKLVDLIEEFSTLFKNY
jgi:hypothetical protein